jgi:predicted DNA-binding antitoxin AbrB/MazE fold protein
VEEEEASSNSSGSDSGSSSGSGYDGGFKFSGVDSEIEEVEEEAPLFEVELEEGEEVSVEILKAKIKNISYYGETSIQFTKNMKVEFESDGELLFNLDSIDESILDVYVEPA